MTNRRERRFSTGGSQFTMWGSNALARARRHLGGGRPRFAERVPVTSVGDDSVDLADLVVALSRTDKDVLVRALAASLERPVPGLDSPRRLADALVTVIDRCGGRGQPIVTRRPAGLYTPEYWHVRLEGGDAPARAAIEQLTAGRAVR